MLKIGIMCRSDSFHAWEASVIHNLIGYRDISIELMILEDLPKTNLISLLRKVSWKNLFWHIYYKLWVSKMRFGSLVNMQNELKDVSRITCQPIINDRFYQYFSNSDLNCIRNYDLDVIIKFGFNIIRGKILDSAKYGVWSFYPNDVTRIQGIPSCFWEIYYVNPLTNAVLQQLTEDLDGGRIIERGYFSTISHSYIKNLNQVYNSSVLWVTRACRRILDCPSSSLFAATHSANGDSEAKILNEQSQLSPNYKLPTNYQVVRFIFRLFINFLSRRVNHAIFKPSWTIGIVKINPEDLFQIKELVEVTWLPSPKGSFFADPFVIKNKGKYYIFFEEYLYSRLSGHISVIETSDFQSFSSPEIVLEKPFHLSYPYVFEHDGRNYCIPEQCQTGKVVLYEARAFPRDWKEIATILNFPGLDPTIIRHNGKWWLFTGREGGEAELFLWVAKDLTGPWRPHPQNPIKTDIRSSRPGGRPFLLKNGNWIRPAQESSISYGRKLVFNEIVALSETCYEERPVHSVAPDPNGSFLEGLHTLDYASDFCIIDGLTLNISWQYASLYLKNKLLKKITQQKYSI